MHTQCSNNSVCVKEWTQGDWINYSKLQVGVFGCQTSLSHTGGILILPHELNISEHTWVHVYDHILHLHTDTHTDPHRCRHALVFPHTQTSKGAHILTHMCLISIRHQCSLTSPGLLILSVTHSDTHTSSQWCITCSGLPPSPLCPCIRCHGGSNVMSLASCSASTRSEAAAHRQDQIAHTWGKKTCDTAASANSFLFYHTGFYVHSFHTEHAIRQKAKVTVKSESGAQGQADTTHQHHNIFCSCGTACPILIRLGSVKSRLNLSQDKMHSL